MPVSIYVQDKREGPVAEDDVDLDIDETDSQWEPATTESIDHIPEIDDAVKEGLKKALRARVSESD